MKVNGGNEKRTMHLARDSRSYGPEGRSREARPSLPLDRTATLLSYFLFFFSPFLSVYF